MLRTYGATRRYGRRTVFSGLDLDLPPGTRLLLAGRNGSGKTTLLRCLAGTLSLSTGRATICGHPAGSPAARRLVGVCLAPERGLYGRLSPRRNLRLVAELRLPPAAATDAVAGTVAEFELADFADLPMERCSAGMRARTAVARAFLGAPALLLLDEPCRSLDEHARALLWAALDRRPALTCVVASHHADARDRCDDQLTLPVRR